MPLALDAFLIRIPRGTLAIIGSDGTVLGSACISERIKGTLATHGIRIMETKSEWFRSTSAIKPHCSEQLAALSVHRIQVSRLRRVAGAGINNRVQWLHRVAAGTRQRTAKKANRCASGWQPMKTCGELKRLLDFAARNVLDANATVATRVASLRLLSRVSPELAASRPLNY